MGDESNSLRDHGDVGAYEDMRERDRRVYCDNLEAMERRYYDNKRSPVGATIQCACCSRRLLKKSYQTQFCSNKGKGNCKDSYWNNVSDNRRERSHRFSR